MSFNYTLQYRTLDSLLADVAGDFVSYDLADAIRPHQLVKVARRVNYDLGLRIFQTKEKVIEIERGKGRLPNDFYTLNFAFLCGKYKIKTPTIQGTQVEERIIDPLTYRQVDWTVDLCPAPVVEPDPCDPCNTCGNPCCTDVCSTCTQVIPDSCSLDCKGNNYVLVETRNFQTLEYEYLEPITILDNSGASVDCDCPNLKWQTRNSAWIKDGWLYTTVQTGKIYVNYQGMLEDEDCNLLVPDHPLLNEYYEYAMKQRVLENLMMDGQAVSPGQIQLIEQRFRSARNNAVSVVNTPNFSELQKVWQSNRIAQYAKYVDMFKSYDPARNAGYNSGFSQRSR